MKRVDMTNGKPFKLLIAFTIPALISNILSQLYSITDSIIVGRFLGKDSLSAIGVCMPIIMLIVSIVIGINIGCGVLFSQSFGNKNISGMRKLVVNSFYFAFILSLVFAVLGFFLSRPILIAMNTPAEVIDLAVTYLQINFLTSLMPLAYYLLNNVFRGMGDSISALLCLIVSVVINIFLDILFVAVFKTGVGGSAIATAISQALAVIFALVIYYIKYKELRIRKEDLKFDFPLILKIVKLAIPFALQFAINNIGNILVQRCINDFGNTVMASYTIGNRISSFALIPVETVGASLAVYVGQNYGAKKEDRIKEGVKASVLMTLSISIVVGAFVLIFGKLIASLFLEEYDPEVINISYLYLVFTIAPCLIYGLMHIYQNVLKGLGRSRDTIISAVISLSTKVVVAFMASLVFSNVLVLWLAWPLSFTLGLVYPFIMYRLYQNKLVKNMNRVY